MQRLLLLLCILLLVSPKSRVKSRLRSRYSLDDMQHQFNLDHYRLDRSMDKMQRDIKEETQDVNEVYNEINKVSVESLQEKFQDNQEALGSQQLYADNFLRRADSNANEHL